MGTIAQYAIVAVILAIVLWRVVKGINKMRKGSSPCASCELRRHCKKSSDDCQEL